MIEKIYFPSFLFGWSGKVEEWKKWVKKEELCPRKKKLKKGKKTKQYKTKLVSLPKKNK